MKRFLVLLAVFFCCAALVIPVSARSGAESVDLKANVADDGSCAVDMTVTVNFDAGVENPTFPIPAAATDILLNGDAASGTTRNGITWLSLKTVGDGTFHLHYRLPAVVTAEKDQPMMLTVPLLSGFSYPVDKLEFTITLPDNVPAEPSFTSSYYQNNASSILDISIKGAAIHGSAENLKDHETLSMSMEVDKEMFPHTAATARVLNLMDLAAVLVAAAAVAYYLLALRPRLPKRSIRTTAPDGVTPGDTILWLHGRKIDFSLLVVTWAQLGYLRIQVEESGRVLLHKRMEMGNERSGFENHCYKKLFGGRRIVDGTSVHYARLCRYANKKAPNIQEVYLKKSGNPYIFTILCALCGLLGGICLAAGFAPHSVFLRILLATLCTVLSLLIHRGAARLWDRNKLPLFIALGCAGLWLLLGILSGTGWKAVLMLLFQTIAGIAAAFGGKRTEPGQQALVQILALRRHMCTASKPELQRLLKSNSGYFHDLAPYALALDADRSFARRFGRLRIPECTWLIGGIRGQISAAEWAKLLRTAVRGLDYRARRLPLERLLSNQPMLPQKRRRTPPKRR